MEQATHNHASRQSRIQRMQRSFLVRLFAIAALLLLMIASVDLALRKSFEATSLLEDAVEIDSPRTLYAKLDALRNFQGLKIAVLGDSLVYGHSLAEHGVSDWHRQNLTATLAKQIEEKSPRQPVMVMNLGMNGALPADIQHLVRLLLETKPDVVIFDVTLRSFSSEFAKPDTQNSRSWLGKIGLSRQGALQTGGPNQKPFEWFESFLSNHWFLYRVRDFLQWRFLDASPRDFVSKLRDSANQRLGSIQKPPTEDELLLLLKAKQRYASVDLTTINPQWRAFSEALQSLESANQKTVVFYATENPDSVGELLPPDRHAAFISKIAEKVAEHSKKNGIVFLPPLPSLNPDMFLDHVHLTAAGFRILSSALIEKAGLRSTK